MGALSGGAGSPPGRKEEKLKRAVDKAEHARYAYCFQREVRLVKALLEEHRAQKNGAE